MKHLICTKLASPSLPLRSRDEEGPGPLELVADNPVPTLMRGHVRILICAASLNFADVLTIQGKYQEKPQLPFVPGSEVSGVIVECARDVTHILVGTSVCAILLSGGAFASECVAPASAVLTLPPSLPPASLQAAAGLPVAFGTAHLALTERARVRAGECVVVLGAGGGVGLAAVQVALKLGARVIAVARGEAKAAVLRSLGASHVVSCSEGEEGSKSLRAQIKEKCPSGVDVLFDNVGGAQFKEAMKTLKWGAQVLIVGFASGEVPLLAANIALVKNLTFHGVYWGSYMKHNPQVLQRSLKEVLQWFANGEIIVHVSHKFPLEQANEGFQTLMTREAVGKVLLTTETTSKL
mmetsp:Transcript_26554/g.36672  ORF Transcript_26554/g.36672 Transcript_26554/m.36672 type:complete len:352 (-) Transcript_26554:52-1107(-)|eukprot:CAMPEP_0196587562 /NCGR_PEP_ID=MMETSP1081-20130531/57815_1 /TAXON_ID=36882 /ORGANISM="Pyramimonas amylifera, Strain CCMP720" /LENGTH=351 /DNA_ID=CAMNT_0041909767 /DNA_START=88 /DNA_END=1143 /DNA_ORIENTATION=-